MGIPEIGLGSLVMQKSGDGPLMVVAAATGDDMFCVSRDVSIPLRVWCHRAMLRTAERLAGTPAFGCARS